LLPTTPSIAELNPIPKSYSSNHIPKKKPDSIRKNYQFGQILEKNNEK
jgi:hypothetical protein